MKNQVFLYVFFICVFGFAKAQSTTLIFGYDKSGNQILRTQPSNVSTNNKTNLFVPNTTEKIKTEEDLFWDKIQIYPVPVKNILTLGWQSETRDLIANINLYEHNSLSNLFTYKVINSDNIEVNMTGFRMGVYILSFTLKNGKTYSKNIIKE